MTNQKSYNSKEAKFLQKALETQGTEKVKNPLIRSLFSAFNSLLTMIDQNENYQKKAEEILNYIKENW